MSEPEQQPPRPTASSLWGALAARLLAVLGGGEDGASDPERERVVTIATSAAIAAMLVVAGLLLMRPGGEPRVQASPVDDRPPTALRPVNAAWTPATGRENATTGSGGMTGNGGVGSFAFFSRGSNDARRQDCPTDPDLPAAVRNVAAGGMVQARRACPPPDENAR